MNEKPEQTSIAANENPAELKRHELAELLPEAFSEGRVDVQALKRALGEESVIEGGERYRLDWAGKSDAYKVLQTPTTATLRPQRDKSVNFDQAQHVFIEGENLEVLKVLQKAYFGKVKLIYIDPPYNTGSDSFIYPDRFQESKEDYLKRINELKDDGTLMREGFFRKNNRESGHFHSNWLSMMLPRLYIARNLLCEDGLIFVSCDDNEVHDLRFLMNDVFGEVNFIDCIIWKKRYGGGAKEKYLVTVHEYILLYARGIENIKNIEVDLNDEAIKRYYVLKDENYELRGAYRTHPLEATKSMGDRPNLVFPISAPDGTEVIPKRQWLWSKDRVEAAIRKNEIAFLKDKDGNWTVHTKQYLKDEIGTVRSAKAFSLIDDIYTQHGTNEIIELFGDAQIFSFPKPSKLIERLIEIATADDKDGLVVDFFAGAGSTAHAVIQRNYADGGSRSSISIQLPERTEPDSAAYRAGFSSIAMICRERILRVLKKSTPALDLANIQRTVIGLKSFVLTPSCFKQWRGDGIETKEELEKQIGMFVRAEKDGAGTEDILYELLLKFGQELTTPIEMLEFPTPSPRAGEGPGERGRGMRAFAIHDRQILFVLENFTEAMIEPLLALKPRQVIALDSVFHDSDELKSNFELQCRDADVKFTCI